MDEGRKRVLAIVARILVARHLKTADEPEDKSMVAAAVQWAERIMRRLIMCFPARSSTWPNQRMRN
jgi:hypothetical protein